MEELPLRLIGEDGEARDCSLLFMFSALDGAKVVVYTDGSADAEGRTRVGCSRIVGPACPVGDDDVVTFEVAECTEKDGVYVRACLEEGTNQ